MPDSKLKGMTLRPIPYTIKSNVKAKLKDSEQTAMLKPERVSEWISLHN